MTVSAISAAELNSPIQPVASMIIIIIIIIITSFIIIVNTILILSDATFDSAYYSATRRALSTAQSVFRIQRQDAAATHE